ncbi:MAG: hypothetical protein ACTFAL_11450 [Candidatus Electronema sp. V4]|uniref:hypothetical protein n=1 Tax=Candidatus Electronema sp. V4 TaxID=3454756 RepID=UPI00405553DF
MKRLLMRHLLFMAALLLAASTAQAAGTWEQVGTAGFSAGTSEYTNLAIISLAIDSGGTPYIAYLDSANSNKVNVMKFSGGSWQQVGTPDIFAGSSISLAIDSSDTPYVAYIDVVNVMRVMKFSGGSWQQVDAPGISACSSISLAIDSSGMPYIAYHQYGINKMSVKKFSGGSWQQVGELAFSAGSSFGTNLVLDSSGTPYVAYVDDANDQKASVMKFNSATSSWEQVGAAGFSSGAVCAGAVCFTNIALDSSGTLYIAYQDWGNGGKMSVMKFNSAASTWEQVGLAGFSAGGSFGTNLVLDSSGTPYVAYSDGANSGKMSVMKFNSAASTWEQVGLAGFSDGMSDYTSLAIDSGGTLYVAYTDSANSGKVSVMKFSAVCGFGRSLPANTWLMTAPACQPDPPDITSQYGDDLGGTYGSTWIAYGWEANAYTPQANIAPLVPGFGSWLYSTGAGTLKLTGSSTPTEDCASYGWPGQQCVAVDLVIPPAGQGRWNMVGHPFPYTVSWADVRVSSSVNGSSWTLRTPSEADASVMRKTFHRWTGSAYEPKDDATPGSIGILQPQEAVWIRTLASDPAVTKIKLLIPAR